MVKKVIALTKGYFGGMVREFGEAFGIPDEIWDDKRRRPRWVKLDPSEAFGGKGDHDGDGSIGGSKPAAPHGDLEGTGPKSDDSKSIVIPADWSSQHHSKRKALAKAITGQPVADLATADNIIAAYVEASKPAPFADAPAPQTVAAALKEVGGIQPDWEAPGAPQPVAD